MSRRKIKRKNPNRKKKPKGQRMMSPRQIMLAMREERKKRAAIQKVTEAMQAANQPVADESEGDDAGQPAE